MGAYIKVDARIVTRKLKRASRNARNMRKAWSEVGRIVLDSIHRTFDVQGRPPWKKRAVKRSHKILQLSGKLRRSIRYRADSGGVRIGTSSAYAATHQYGRGAIPARPFLGIQAEDEGAIRKALLSHLKGSFE